jgi:hypothetical protein
MPKISAIAFLNIILSNVVVQRTAWPVVLRDSAIAFVAATLVVPDSDYNGMGTFYIKGSENTD